MSANTDAELRKRKFPHSTHGETRHKPHNNLGRSVGMYKRKSQRKVRDIGERWVQPPYDAPPRERLTAIFDAMFSCGMLGGNS